MNNAGIVINKLAQRVSRVAIESTVPVADYLQLYKEFAGLIGRLDSHLEFTMMDHLDDKEELMETFLHSFLADDQEAAIAKPTSPESPSSAWGLFIYGLGHEIVDSINKCETPHVIAFNIICTESNYYLYVCVSAKGMQHEIGRWKILDICRPSLDCNSHYELFKYYSKAIGLCVVRKLEIKDKSEFYCIQVRYNDVPIGDLA